LAYSIDSFREAYSYNSTTALKYKQLKRCNALAVFELGYRPTCIIATRVSLNVLCFKICDKKALSHKTDTGYTLYIYVLFKSTTVYFCLFALLLAFIGVLVKHINKQFIDVFYTNTCTNKR